MDSIKFLKAALLTSSLGLAVTACSPAAQKASEVEVQGTSIIGGSQVAADDAIGKSTVALLAFLKASNGGEGQATCTGSLLTSETILTAGHCIPKVGDEIAPGVTITEVTLVAVFSRDINAAQRADVRLVAGSVVHPQYGKMKENADMNDVAVVRFIGGMPAGYEVAKFLDDESALKMNGKVTLAGYGYNKTDGLTHENDDTLRKVDVEIMGAFGETEIALDQSNGRGACHGDSGGPAFVNVEGVEYVWGITSRGNGKDGKDDCSFYSLYTRVKAQRPFIDAAITALTAPAAPVTPAQVAPK